MIIGTGYGLLLVLAIYAVSLFGVSQYIPSNMSEIVQIVLIIVTVFLSTIVNYIVAKRLNRKEIKHTVYNARLETVVLCIGTFLLFMAFIMFGGAVKNL